MCATLPTHLLGDHPGEQKAAWRPQLNEIMLYGVAQLVVHLVESLAHLAKREQVLKELGAVHLDGDGGASR